MPSPTFTITTAPSPGAIGIVQLRGDDAPDLLRRLTGVEPSHRSRLVEIAGIDEALLVRLRPDWWQLMPHGGPRVMQRLAQRMTELDAVPDADPPASLLYPEAECELEAWMLAALSRAASPAAIDRLLNQPTIWRQHLAQGEPDWAATARRTRALDSLLDPPTVVVVGRANVGKSTLSNHVMGRAASITADLPGTTRDWVAGLAELPTPLGDVAVRWFDTPGLRQSEDAIEQRAIELARSVVTGADVLIAMRDSDLDWPDAVDLPRAPDVWVVNKCDDPAAMPDVGDRDALAISALTGRGMDELSAAILSRIGLNDVDDGPWAFAPMLKQAMERCDAAVIRAALETRRSDMGR